MSSCFLLDFLTSGPHSFEVIADGIPPDGKVVAVTHDISTGFILVTIASSTFDGPPEGGEIPELAPVRMERK